MKKSKISLKRQVALLLENIRSAENVGSIFRTADAAGVLHVYLAGYTPAPTDRFNRPNAKIATRALGAEKNIPWTSVARAGSLVTKLKKSRWQIVAIEQSPKAVDYKKVKIGENVLFVLGNEVDGISKSLLEKADIVAEIPMHGKKESLNVSVATGVALFRILNI
ncbi:MAG: hypothetical protein RL641_926 [Candidatus Parcubacteria bacterium]|jgi:tRNA G18 (ribose-2'-O)-methylase SpoU